MNIMNWYKSDNPFKRAIGNVLIFPSVVSAEITNNRAWIKLDQIHLNPRFHLTRRQSYVTSYMSSRQNHDIHILSELFDQQSKLSYLRTLEKLLSRYLFHRENTGFYARQFDTWFLGKYLNQLYKLRYWSDVDIAEETAIAFHQKIISLPEHARLIALLCAKVQAWEKVIRRRPNISDGEKITEHLLHLCLTDLQEIPSTPKTDRTSNNGLNNIRMIGEFINQKLLTNEETIDKLVTMLVKRAYAGDVLAIEQVCLLLKVLQENRQIQRASSRTISTLPELIGIKAVVRSSMMLHKLSDNGNHLPSSIKKTVKKTLALFEKVDK